MDISGKLFEITDWTFCIWGDYFIKKIGKGVDIFQRGVDIFQKGGGYFPFTYTYMYIQIGSLGFALTGKQPNSPQTV